MPGTVTSKWTLDTADFDAPLKRTVDLTTASGRAIELSAQKAAQAQALAAKLGSDAVSAHTLKIIQARHLEVAASADLRKAQALSKAGYDGEAGGANLEAAALQRLTAAKMKTVEATRLQAEASHKGLLALREHIEGLSVGGAVGENILGIGAALGVAELANKLREAVTASLEFGEAIQRASEKTGLEVRTLSTLHYAAAVTGGDFDSMTTAVAKMDKTIGDATEGNKRAQAFVKSLGLDAKDLAGRTDGAEVAFRRFAAVLSATEDPIRRAELAQALLGKTGAQQIPMLIQVGENWEGFQKKATDAGVMLDTKTAAQLEATQQRLKDLQQHIMGAGLAFTDGFIPGFEKMLGVISGGKSEMDAMKDFGGLVAKGLDAAATAAYGFVSGLRFIDAAMSGGAFTESGRKALISAHALDAKAEGFRDLLIDRNPNPLPTPQLGDDVADFLDRNNLGGRGKKATNSEEGFGGVGDLSGAADKAAQERLRGMETELNQLKLQGNLSTKWEYDYWQARIGMFKAGSTEYASVVAKSAELAVAGARKAAETIKRFQESQVRLSGGPDGDEIVARYAEQRQRDAVKALGESSQDQLDSNRLSIEKAHNDAREREAQLTDQAGRSMSKYAASIELAKVHAEEFRQVMEALQANLDVKQYQQSLAPTKEGAKGVAEAQVAIANASSQRAIQLQGDTDAIYGRQTSAIVGATDALNDFIIASRDSATEVRNLVSKTLSSLNSELVKAISTRGSQRAGFADFGASIGRDVAGSALQKGEGSILGMFGLGGAKKPTGSKGDPLFVALDGTGTAAGAAGAGVAAAVPFISLLPGGSDASSDSSGPASSASKIGSNVTGIFSSILKLLPGFADGGAIAPNTWAMVGERGPEPFFSGPGGTIIPNGKSLGGGDTNHTWNVDARGSNDPAAVEAAVQRGIMAAAPHIAAMGARGYGEQRMRIPPSQRG